MKKLVLLSMLGMLWMGCTKQESTVKPEERPLESNYLKVSIASVGSPGSRSTDSDENYKDGESYENHINRVIFFFFDDQYDAAKVFREGDVKVSYKEWIPTDDEQKDVTDTPTIEKKLETTLTFSLDVKDEFPTKVLAVLNPPQTFTKESLSLSELTAIVADYEGYNNGDKTLAPRSTNNNTGFVMTNSVYVDNSGAIITTSDCKDKFKTTKEAAEEDPVCIYVERVLARIDLQIKIKKGKQENDETPYRKEITPNDGKEPYYIYYTGETVSESVSGTGKDEKIYVRFLGWNVFDTPNQSYLVKSIKKWDATLFYPNDPTSAIRWNSSEYYRSFWAINPVLTESDYRHGSLIKDGGITDVGSENGWTADKNDVPSPNSDKTYFTDYFQENAALSENTLTTAKPSKVIIAAQLVDENGTPRQLAKWAGKTYAYDDLKIAMANGINLWTKSETTDPKTGAKTTTYTHISMEDLEFSLPDDDSESKRCTVTLSSDAQNKTWYTQLTFDETTKNGTYEELTKEQVTEKLKNEYGIDNISVWTNGYAYYYFTIRHLSEDPAAPGYYGVVRNHIYDATITSVTGFGIPVAKPDDDITTTEDLYKEGELKAEVKILQWRVVRNDYDLTW